MKYRSARKLILHTCEKYWDAKHSYKKLLIYCFIEQGANFPLSIDDLMRCYSTETIRRTFQDMKRKGEIDVPEAVQEDWNKKEQRVRAEFSPRKKKHIDLQEFLATHTFTDQEGNVIQP